MDFSIGQVAEAAGLRTSAIRYYEEIGILPKAPRVSGRRRYTAETLQRLAMVALAQQAGFSLDEAKVLLQAMDGRRGATKHLQRMARAKLPEVEESLRRGAMVKKVLTAATKCQCPDLTTCVQLARREGLIPNASLEIG